MIVRMVYIFNNIEVGSKKMQICIRIDRFCNSEKCLCWLPDCEELAGGLKGDDEDGPARIISVFKRWLKETNWIVLQNEERGSVEYSSHAYAETEPWAASPLTQPRFASGNSLFGTVLGTVRMGHDSRLAHDRLHRCAARL